MGTDEYMRGVGSVSMEKENSERSDGLGVWVKLTIPKEEKEEGGLHINGDENKKRVCHICHKTFSSGKALGGHMRIHVQSQQPNKKDHGGGVDSKKLDSPICFICCKEFKSMKSLSGHMRSHPERVWRGIRPPSDDQIRVSVSGEKDSRVLDLTQLLPRAWPVTAKRGRKATTVGSSSEASSLVDDQLWKAVNYLMMMKMKNYDDVLQLNLLSESKTNEGATSDVVHGESINVGSFSDDDDEREDLESRKSYKVMVKSNKKKRKKMKELFDLQSSEIASATPVLKYRSGHNISASGVLESDEVSKDKVLEIDLNEVPQSE